MVLSVIVLRIAGAEAVGSAAIGSPDNISGTARLATSQHETSAEAAPINSPAHPQFQHPSDLDNRNAEFALNIIGYSEALNDGSVFSLS